MTITKIKQLIPVPKHKEYYAVFFSNEAECGYSAEPVDCLAVVTNIHKCDAEACDSPSDDQIVGVCGGYMELACAADNYYGTFSESGLRSEIPELWAKIFG